jgi:TldD protein
MKNSRLGVCLVFALACAFPFHHIVAAPAAAQKPTGAQKDDVLLSSMQAELQRAQGELSKQDPGLYFLSYSVHEQDSTVALATEGTLLTSGHPQARTADVVVRVGTPALDNTHLGNRVSAIISGRLPREDDRNAIARVLWGLTYEEYRKAAAGYLNVKTGSEVQAKEEDTSPDFSAEKPSTHLEPAHASASVDQAALEKLVRQYSAGFRKYPDVYTSLVTASIEHSRELYVSSEGSRVVTPGGLARVSILAQTRADDGMELLRVETFQANTLDQLPSPAEIDSRVEKMAADLKALRAAPIAEPYDGPALLSGRAAAVFFHEVLGHRLEGHRQRGEEEGQTFTKKVDKQVLPEFLSVADDPTQRVLDGVPLSGFYEYDDEGMPAERVNVIQNGILKNFLMSRMPITGFAVSNGHGRAQAGLMATGRQGNLIVSSSKTVKDSALRQLLKDEIKKQGKPYGLYFEDIQGGFTLTQRSLPQAFEVLPILVWRVYPDDRPDELVRGVNIVGTPLTAMEQILATGDHPTVFNGICGAESGSVPVSAVAPAMLFSEIEVQKQGHSLDRPPILPPPGFEKPNAVPPSASGVRP